MNVARARHRVDTTDTERTTVSRESRRFSSEQEQRSPWGESVCGELRAMALGIPTLQAPWRSRYG